MARCQLIEVVPVMSVPNHTGFRAQQQFISRQPAPKFSRQRLRNFSNCTASLKNSCSYHREHLANTLKLFHSTYIRFYLFVMFFYFFLLVHCSTKTAQPNTQLDCHILLNIGVGEKNEISEYLTFFDQHLILSPTLTLLK